MQIEKKYKNLLFLLGIMNRMNGQDELEEIQDNDLQLLQSFNFNAPVIMNEEIAALQDNIAVLNEDVKQYALKICDNVISIINGTKEIANNIQTYKNYYLNILNDLVDFLSNDNNALIETINVNNAVNSIELNEEHNNILNNYLSNYTNYLNAWNTIKIEIQNNNYVNLRNYVFTSLIENICVNDIINSYNTINNIFKLFFQNIENAFTYLSEALRNNYSDKQNLLNKLDFDNDGVISVIDLAIPYLCSLRVLNTSDPKYDSVNKKYNGKSLDLDNNDNITINDGSIFNKIFSDYIKSILNYINLDFNIKYSDTNDIINIIMDYYKEHNYVLPTLDQLPTLIDEYNN